MSHTVNPEAVQVICEQVAEECYHRYCSVGGWDAPSTYTETVDGIVVAAEVEGDPDGNYVSFTAKVDGVEIASGSIVGRTLHFEMAS